MEETLRFVCTTSDRIVKNTTEFIQNVDWKKVAIGVGTTLVVAAAVAVTGGAIAAATPVLIGAAIGAGTSTGITIVSGAIQGKSPAEIAKDSSDAFMWGAIGGAVGGGTTSILQNAGKSAAGSYIKNNLIEGGMDTVVDLAQTGSQNGKITGKDVITSVVVNVGGALLSAPDTPSTSRNQIVNGVTDNKAVKNAVADSVTDSKKYTTGTPQEVGKIGEELAGLSGANKNTKVISGPVSGKNRIPDGLNTDTGLISEVKNVKSQSLTSQIKDDIAYAQNNGYDFELWTRPDTHITKPLQNEIDNGNVIQKFLW